jgi:hypothetical protein
LRSRDEQEPMADCRSWKALRLVSQSLKREVERMETELEVSSWNNRESVDSSKCHLIVKLDSVYDDVEAIDDRDCDINETMRFSSFLCSSTPPE